MSITKLLENLEEITQERTQKKAEYELVLKEIDNKLQQAEQELDEYFYSNKLYLPLYKLNDYNGSNVTSVRCPTGLHRCACLSDVRIIKGKFESGDYDINNDRFLGFYDMYIDGKLLEETSRGYLCRKELLKETINQNGRTWKNK